jgi:hypothetical protein
VNTTPSKPPRAPGFWWALAGFSLGSLVSVGFNLQSAWLPAAEHGPGWSPSIPSLAAAAVWPLTLIVSVEVLSRVPWPDGRGWKLVRFSGILAVALGSATISYGHIYEVLRAWGYEQHQAIVGPLVVDGLMLISGFALVALGRATRTAGDTAQAPAVPANTDTARRPQVPPQAGDEPHAVSPTTPHDAVGETVPSGQPARAARPVMRPAAQAPARPKRAARPASGKAARLSDEDLELVARLRAARDPNTGELPKVPWMRQEFGIGQSRAARLREAAARPDLHTVKEEVAVG